jgi:hypothetical protein
MNSIPHFAATLDAGGLIISSECKMNGESDALLEGIEGINWFDTFLNEEDYAEVRSIVQGTLKTLTATCFDGEMSCADSKSLSLQFCASPVFVNDNETRIIIIGVERNNCTKTQLLKLQEELILKTAY